MAVVKPQQIYFKGDLTGVTAVRVRVHAASSEPKSSDPFEDFDADELPAPDPKTGRVIIDVSEIDALQNFEGEVDVAVSFVDAAGNESDMMDGNNLVFDQTAPAAPTEVGIA